MRANTQKCTTRGAEDKSGGRGKEKNSGELRYEEICGREGWGGGTQGKQYGHCREFEGGGLTGLEKIKVLDGGR